ncbi:MAG: PspC domain-containing protein [Candidatus Viridilinea halotolerans]|uniref:PspC domain-containing protein n=1 Tax=Candidatus Viridilinea halotolerans TaxID=2491704 RepID=A0A426U6F6_9CHLR|nr:MAG: PspC domain-containing protein [Candidatus Viridilinea halotolerans]
MDTKRITRSRNERVIAGVAGGLADYFQIDPLFVRLAFIVLGFVNGLGGILYFTLWMIVPNEGSRSEGQTTVSDAVNEMRTYVQDLAHQIRAALQR